MKHQDLTHKIIGCAMEVHKHLGNGFQEVVYQRALSIELNMNNIKHVREQEMDLTYKSYNIGTRRVDFFIEDEIMLEIKALTHLEDVHLAQAMNYVEAYNLEIGLLINFGAKSLEFKRVHNNKFKPSKQHTEKSSHQVNPKHSEQDIKKSSHQVNPTFPEQHTEKSSHQVNPKHSEQHIKKSSHQVNPKNQGSDNGKV